MIIKYMKLSNQTKHHFLTNTILVARIYVLKVVLLSLIFVFFLSYQFIPAIATSVPVFYHLGIMI